MVQRLTAGRYFGRVAAGDIGGFGLAESAYERGTHLRPHAHERDHFILIVSGSYEETVSGRARRCKTADVLFLPRDTVHEERHESDGRHFMIDVPPPQRDRVRQAALARPRALESVEARRVMRRLRAEFLRRDRSALAIEGLAILLLAELEGEDGASRAGAMPAFVRQADEFIRAHFANTISLDDVAAAVGVDAGKLSVGFRRWKGRTVGDVVRERQVALVCRLLETTEEPIARVAHTAGFCDHAHCCRVFKQTLGLTPREYQAASKSENGHARRERSKFS